jgi:hypothetical protein
LKEMDDGTPYFILFRSASPSKNRLFVQLT